jgi:GNAT superfamily N-acetyltransferase
MDHRRCGGPDRRVNVDRVQYTLRRTPFTDAVAQALCEEVQAEYTQRYGGGDDTLIELDDFDPPNGDFIVAFDAEGAPLGCGGWRAHEAADAEMKRVYVRQSARRRGLAKLIVAAIEASAAEAGRKRVILETGPRQPEAIAMYRALGYRPITPFGYYSDAEGSLHLGKELHGEIR